MRKGGKKRGAAGGSKTVQQQRLTSFALPLLKKPMEVIGKQVGVKDAYWDGRQTDEEKASTFMCSVVDYSISDTFPVVLKSTIEPSELMVSFCPHVLTPVRTKCYSLY